MTLVVVGVGVVQQPEVDGTVLVETDVVTVDGAGERTGIDLGVDVGKVQFGQGDVLVPADDRFLDGTLLDETLRRIYANILHYIPSKPKRFQGPV